MKIKWAKSAVLDLKNIRAFIRKENPTAAARVASRILSVVELLETQPMLGHAGRLPNTREMVVDQTPFLIIYTVSNQCLQIIRILHGTYMWPQ